MSQEENANEKEKIAKGQSWNLSKFQRPMEQEEEAAEKTEAAANEVDVKPQESGYWWDFLMKLRKQLKFVIGLNLLAIYILKKKYIYISKRREV